MSIIVIDIETLSQDPEDFVIPDVETLKPPGTHKKPETIAKWRAEKAATIVGELREKSSLEPLYGGTVFAIGLAVEDKDPVAFVAESGDEAGELRILTTLQRGLLRYQNTHTLVTWNGAKFDLPFLKKRALRHGLWDLARICHYSKPWEKGQLDLMQVWLGSDWGARGKLREVEAYLGLERRDTITGAEVDQAFREGNLDLVRNHVLEDVRLTREVYWRFRRAGWVVAEEPALPAELPVRPPRVLQDAANREEV